MWRAGANFEACALCAIRLCGKLIQCEKLIVISTTSWFGGQNVFLGILYVIVGALWMVLAILFFVNNNLSPRKLADTRCLSWKNILGKYT